MADTVVAMPGFQVPRIDREPVANVVEILEDLLQQARRGEVVGLAYGAVLDRGSGGAPVLLASSNWAHGQGVKHNPKNGSWRWTRG
jgi:hypothetical protein